MKKTVIKQKARKKRKASIRKKISGTPECPRMSVFRSNKNMYVQVIDDVNSHTLASVSTLEKEFAGMRNTTETASKVGEEIGNRLKAKNIDTVIFDRNGYLYHGIVKHIADGARKAGIKF